MRFFVSGAICLVLSLHLNAKEHVIKLEHAHKTDWLNVVNVGGHHKDVGVVTLANKGPTRVEDHSSLLEIGLHFTKNLVPDEYHDDLKRHHDAFLQAHEEKKKQKGSDGGADGVFLEGADSEKFQYKVESDNLPPELKQNESMMHLYEKAPLGVVTTRNIANSQYMGDISVGTPPVRESVVFDTGSTNCWITTHGCDSGACPHISNKYDPSTSTTANPTHWVENPNIRQNAKESVHGKDESNVSIQTTADHESLVEMVDSHGFEKFDRDHVDSSFLQMDDSSFLETANGMDSQAALDLFHYKYNMNSTHGFAGGTSPVEGWPDLFKSYYLHIRFGTGEIIGWTQKDTIRFGPVEVKQQIFGMIKEEKGSIFVALQKFAGIMGLGLPSMAAQGSRPVMDSAMQQGLPGVFAFYMEPRSDWPSAFMFGGVLKETLASNLHLVEVYQPHYWSMRLLRLMVGNEQIPTEVKSLVVDSGTSSLTADSSILPAILAKLAKRDCHDIGGNAAKGILPMEDFKFVVAVNGGQDDPVGGFIEYDIVLTPAQYMLHSAGSSDCSPAWWNIDVPPPYGPAFLLGELFLKHFMTIFRREQNGAPAVMAIASAQQSAFLEGTQFYDKLIAGSSDDESKKVFSAARSDGLKKRAAAAEQEAGKAPAALAEQEPGQASALETGVVPEAQAEIDSGGDLAEVVEAPLARSMAKIHA